MPRFQYVALDARGQEWTGLVKANSANEAIGQLRQAGYFPTGVYEEGKAPASRNGKVKKPRTARVAVAAAPAAKRKGVSITLFKKQKVKSKVLMIFTRQLATLIDSGLPLLRSLNVLGKSKSAILFSNAPRKRWLIRCSAVTPFLIRSRSIRKFLTTFTSAW